MNCARKCLKEYWPGNYGGLGQDYGFSPSTQFAGTSANLSRKILLDQINSEATPLMKIVNRFVFGCLVFLGSLLLIGIFMNSGSLMGLSSFLGWFFAVFSITAYLVVSILHAAHQRATFWMELYPTNFGLAIVGISIFGFTGEENLFILIAALLFAMATPFAAHRWATGRAMPIAALGLLFVPLIPWVTPFWMYLYLIVGLALVSISIFEQFARKKSPRRAQ